NGEIQMAKNVPPHMADRINNSSNAKIVLQDSAEVMFMGMRPDTKPFDDKRVRQAVAYGIDKDSIIKNILLGYAKRLDGPENPGQYAYDPNLQPKYTYDPAKAKQLLADAGYPNGVDVELFSTAGRYTQDKQLSEAMTQM